MQTRNGSLSGPSGPGEANPSDRRETRQACALKLPSSTDWLTPEVDAIAFVETDERELGLMVRTISRFDQGW